MQIKKSFSKVLFSAIYIALYIILITLYIILITLKR